MGGLFVWSIFRFKVLNWFCGWEDRALQECNLSAQLPVDCGSIPPGPGSTWRQESFF